MAFRGFCIWTLHTYCNLKLCFQSVWCIYTQNRYSWSDWLTTRENGLLCFYQSKCSASHFPWKSLWVAILMFKSTLMLLDLTKWHLKPLWCGWLHQEVGSSEDLEGYRTCMSMLCSRPQNTPQPSKGPEKLHQTQIWNQNSIFVYILQYSNSKTSQSLQFFAECLDFLCLHLHYLAGLRCRAEIQSFL